MDNFRGSCSDFSSVCAMSDWDVPGYEVLELLGFGTSGELWRARDKSTGARVALRRLAGGDKAAVLAVKAQATIVRSLPTAHVIRLRTTTRAGRDDVLVLDHAAGGSLASLLLRRGRLTPGEVVTAVAPLAEALGQAHAHGLVHGRLSATSVLLSGQGMPLLDGLGMAALHDPEDGLDPTGGLGASADVWALGALAHELLTGERPGSTILASLAPRAPLPLVRAIESALGFDATARPTAADLCSALLAACPALPIEGIVPAPDPAADAPRNLIRMPSRTALVAGAAVLCVLAVTAVGWAWGTRAGERPSQLTTTRAAVAHTPVADWKAVLEHLDGARADAFAHADAARLDDVYVRTSQARARDAEAISRLVSFRRTAVGVEHELATVTAMTVTRDRAELRVLEALGATELLDGAGRVVEDHAAGPVSTHRVVLLRTSSGWRVLDVAEA
ncbi:MAG: Serine/threonine protein kinase [Frankiales bacterium]|nr:Serine/threonine protein kinase [Frankiales bacterium]